jgi:hypothetical protein
VFIKPYIFYPIVVLSIIIGYGIGGSVRTPSIINNTLKMCNQKPLECKFKYDILMYNETGKVPYTEQKQTPKPTDKK